MAEVARPDKVTPTSEARPPRRRDLDLMRMFVVVGLVFFHSARVFDTGEFYVKSDPTSEVVSIGISFAALWGMPLLFVVAGMGIWYSLRSRTPNAFAQKRRGCNRPGWPARTAGRSRPVPAHCRSRNHRPHVLVVRRSRGC